MKEDKKRQAVAYLKEKQFKDLKDELMIMKISHLLSMPKVRYGMLASIDIVFFFLISYGTNVLKGTIGDLSNMIRGNSTFSLLDIHNFSIFNHSFTWYIVAVIILIIMDVRIHYMIYTNYRDINRNQKGSTRWSTLEEIREQYPAVPLKFKQPYQTHYGKGGVPVCQYGTHYEMEAGQPVLKDIDKGVIYIDHTPVNNLIIGITRSGKGEMFVFVIIDIYSRSENKYYTLDLNRNHFFSADIYYDYRDGEVKMYAAPERIEEGRLAFGQKEFQDTIKNYEKEHMIKLRFPKEYNETSGSLFDYIDNENVAPASEVSEQMVISYRNKIKPKKHTDDKLELKLLSKKICITDRETGRITEYEFLPCDGVSKKNALDEAFLYLGMIHHPFEGKYEDYRQAMGFEIRSVSCSIDENTNINHTEVEELKKLVTEEELLTRSTAYQEHPVDEEPILDGLLETEKKRIDYLELLKETARINHLSGPKAEKFHFTRNYQASMVISDPKLELFRASKPILELRGYKVYCINLIDPYESSGYNPLQLITDTYKSGEPAEASAIARSLATSIFATEEGRGENAFFYDNAAFLTAALIMSEVIDELHADEEANKKYLQKHIEATERFLRLPDEKKQECIAKGEQLEELRLRRRREKDTYQCVMLDRKIEKLEEELSSYNYKQEPFSPRNDNEKKINLPNVLLKFTSLAEKTLPPAVEGAEPKNALDVFFENRDILDVARNLYSAIRIAGGERVKGSVYSTVLSKLTGFMDDKIKKMTAYSSFRLTSIGFGERPVAVFLAMPDYDNSNAFIQSIFISQVYYALAKKAISSGGKCKREVIFLLDEFGNIPCINNMASMITVCLGRNIRFNLVVQAYSQLDKEYGEHDSDTIYGNCGNQIYIQTDNYETAEQFSNLIGKETIVNVTRMGGELALTTQKQYTESTEEKPLLNPNELMEFMEGECVVKRVMMRKDQYNNRVKPRPIYNTGKTVFPLRYQYMGDWFDTDNHWEDIHADSCSSLNLSLYLSDFESLLKDMEMKTTEEYQEWYQMTMENYEKNKQYPIGDFVNKQEIERQLIVQVDELRSMPQKKLETLALADIEKYYIKYESNLPAFRQRMYAVSDWTRTEDKTFRCYSGEILRFFRLALGNKADEVWDLYEFEDEEKLLSTTTEEAIIIMSEQGVPENNIIQFKTALKKYERKENVL